MKKIEAIIKPFKLDDVKEALTAIGVMHNHTAQMLRNFVGGLLLGLSPVRRAMADTLTEITIGYPHSPPNGPHVAGDPAPGDRVPPVAGPPVGAGDRPQFALFAAPGAATERYSGKRTSASSAPRTSTAARTRGCSATARFACSSFLRRSSLSSDATEGVDLGPAVMSNATAVGAPKWARTCRVNRSTAALSVACTARNDPGS